MNLACLFTKTPHSKKENFAISLDIHISQLLKKQFQGDARILVCKRFDNVGNLPEKFYAHLNQWEGYEQMTKDLQGMPMDLRLYIGPEDICDYLKSITGATHGETNPETLRGWIAQQYPNTIHNWFNGIHVSSQDELERDLTILRQEIFLPTTLQDWKNAGICNHPIMSTLQKYGWC